jgi:hypothetical protein
LQACVGNQRKVGKLLDFLPCRGERAFDRFIYALVVNDQDENAKCLDPLVAQKYITDRNEKMGMPGN